MPSYLPPGERLVDAARQRLRASGVRPPSARKRRCQPAAADNLTVRQVADRLGLAKVDAVLKLIRDGRLPASNISSGRGRPTWRIAAADLNAFVAAGRTRPATAKQARRPRGGDVIEFY